ncbi:MAG: hypothetical protein IIB94_08445, partial [Candidatus Marinimicrobia bacterium]|nr:hypothetical protein [Candidatus Neomarinimicrobiota bacterium]
GGVLPQGEFLANWIKQNIGIPEKLKIAWADYFRKAAETAGLLMLRQDGTAQLRSNPIVQNADWTGVSKEPIGEEKKIENQPPSNTPRDAFVVDKLFAGLEGGSLATYILSGDKKALFFIPDGLSVSDAKKLEPAIKALEQQIQALMAASSDGLETKRENEID